MPDYPRLLFLSLIISIATLANAQMLPTTRFEASRGTQTPTYAEIIDWWKKLDEASGKVKMLTMGMTDAGYPLSLVVVSNNGDVDFAAIRKRNKRIILINNGIHPGEPDGIDASMLLVRDVVANRYKLPDNVVLALIPVYNIGGCLDRSSNYRVDQNGPEEFGFRGNSQNLDLNRDFIKCDSKEARAFTEIFRLLDPDVFVDNHVSDGADYQHIITLLSSQHDKLGGVMGEFMDKHFTPAMFTGMKEKGYDLVPYVNFWGANKVEEGWQEFWDSPRYSSGYASLFDCFSFMPETHMLKSYEQRVKAAYALMQTFIAFTSDNSEKIRAIRQQARLDDLARSSFPVKWQLDKSVVSRIVFRGFESGTKPSEISGQPRLYYDRTKPYTKGIPFFNHYKAVDSVTVPVAYVIPQGWWKVIDLLSLNGVTMRRLVKDTTIEVEVYRVDDFKPGMRSYEGHHVNTDVKVSVTRQQVHFRKGDLYIPTAQRARRYIVETLEPKGEDSFFAWNFFDPILGQKEGYSDYVFEDLAADYLKTTPEVRQKLLARRSSDTAFAKNGAAQLNYVYQQSPWIEPAYLRYPVARVVK